MFQFLINYWYIGALILLLLLYILVRRYAKGKAREIAMHYLQQTEKVVFTTSDARIGFVLDSAYKALPPLVRSLVPFAVFSVIVVNVYEESKHLFEHLHDEKVDNK